MSATNRGAERPKGEKYPTPSWCTHRLVEGVHLPGDHWLEPAVGDGAIVRAVNQTRPHIQWTTADLYPDSGFKLDVETDFLWFGCPELRALMPSGGWDVLCTNPPYRYALEFAQNGLTMARVVVLLLRLNWLATAKRYDWLKAHPPDVYILPDRPVFRGDHSDATEYAWMRWGVDSPGGHWFLLDQTPERIRGEYLAELKRKMKAEEA